MTELDDLIGIAVLGMDRRSVAVLATTFDSKLNRVCKLADFHKSDAVIIDMDSNNFGELWQQVKQDNPDLPIIVLSLRPQNIKGTLYLRKPFSVNSFLGLLKLLFATRFYTAEQQNHKSQRFQDTRAGKLRVITQMVDATETFYDPQQFAVSYVRKAVRSCDFQNPFVLLECWNNKNILVNFVEGTISTNFQEGSLRALGLVHVHQDGQKINTKSVKQDFVERLDGVWEKYTIEAFLWKLGLLTARGRIPLVLDEQQAFDLESVVYISQWPNLSRLDLIPGAIKMVALWMQHPCSPATLAKVLGVKQALVNNLFSAAYFAGIAGLALRQADSVVVVEEPLAHRQRSLFGDIMDRLTGLA